MAFIVLTLKKIPLRNLLTDITFKYALENRLGIMDATAFTLAAENKQTIRVFSVFAENALIKAAEIF